jgi:hypothetical protein
MKKGLGVIGILLVVAALFFFARSSKETAGTARTDTGVASATGNGPSSEPSGAPQNSIASTAKKSAGVATQGQANGPAPEAGELVAESAPPADLPAETVLQNVGKAVHLYGQMFDGNPVGTNPEITSELGGNNPKHANFISPQQGMRVNGSGELVDAWGTPYFFHQISGTETEIHSAGPDRKMWTADDIVVK